MKKNDDGDGIMTYKEMSNAIIHNHADNLSEKMRLQSEYVRVGGELISAKEELSTAQKNLEVANNDIVKNPSDEYLAKGKEAYRSKLAASRKVENLEYELEAIDFAIKQGYTAPDKNITKIDQDVISEFLKHQQDDKFATIDYVVDQVFPE